MTRRIRAYAEGTAFSLASLCLAAALPAAALGVERNPPLKPVIRSTEVWLRIMKPAKGAVLKKLDVPDPDGRLSTAWQPFVGQRITPGLIDQIEAAVNTRLDELNRPLTARWTPDAGVAPGTLTFNLVPVTAANVTVTGPGADEIKARLGLMAAQPMNPGKLAAAIDDLNRYPYRQVTSNQTPDGQGLALTVSEQKPWQVYTGYKYESSPALTWQRWFAGFTVGDLLGRDSVLSFQATASPDALPKHVRHPLYQEGYLTYSLPLDHAGTIEASVDVPAALYHYPEADYWLNEPDATLDYRLPLHDRDGANTGDVRFGIEARHERARTIIGGVQTDDSAENMYEVFAGFHRLSDTAAAHDELDVSLHISPGGVDRGNSDAHFNTYSGGRTTSARYGYLYLTYDHAQALTRHFTWHTNVNAMVATEPMPYWIQGIVGGLSAVRGYFFYDGAGDDMIVVRNEVGLASRTAGSFQPSPYLFVDYGVGHDAQTALNRTLASTGMGITLPLTSTVTLNLDAARTLRRGLLSPSGSNALEANLTYRY